MQIFKTMIRFFVVVLFVLSPISFLLHWWTDGASTSAGVGVIIGMVGVVPFMPWILQPVEEWMFR